MVHHLGKLLIMIYTMQLVKTPVRLLFLLAAFFSVTIARAQDQKDSSFQQMIEAKSFIFKAQSALPLRGSTRQLTSEYDLKLLGDSVVSYLPYFGRAYSAPMNPNEGGIQFTSTDFNYSVKKKKKGWDVTILPKDTKDVRELFLSISTGGYASLRAISNNRDAISYNGIVEKVR